MYLQIEAFTGTWSIRLSFFMNKAGVNQIVTMTAHLKGFYGFNLRYKENKEYNKKLQVELNQC